MYFKDQPQSLILTPWEIFIPWIVYGHPGVCSTYRMSIIKKMVASSAISQQKQMTVKILSSTETPTAL
jgi:hypothetical protein